MKKVICCKMFLLGFLFLGLIGICSPAFAGPETLWSLYFGGAGDDYHGNTIVGDGSGNMYVTGRATSADFSGAINDYSGGWSSYNLGDAFVTKVGASGALAWTSLMGGSSVEAGTGICLDSSGNVIIVGYTASHDLPLANNVAIWGTDSFVAKMDASGNLIWSSYIGGRAHDYAYAVTSAGAGAFIVTGSTQSVDLPKPKNAHHEGYPYEDCFVMKMSSAGTVLWSRYLGGTEFDVGNALQVDSQGNIVIMGTTNSPDFEGMGNNIYFTNVNDIFVTKLSPGGDMVWSYFYGGDEPDTGLGLDIDSSDNIYITGEAQSEDFVGVQNDHHGGFNGINHNDVIVSKLSPLGAVQWSTYVGGSSLDSGVGIGVGASGNIVVAGTTASTDFEGAANSRYGYRDCFIAELDGTGQQISASYMGGTDDATLCAGFLYEAAGDGYIYGWTDSEDIAGHINSYYGGDMDLFIARISNFERGFEVKITSPTDAEEWQSSAGEIRLGGTASDIATTVTWSNDRGGSGECDGTAEWNCDVNLSLGKNIVTITAMGENGSSAADVIEITYEWSITGKVFVKSGDDWNPFTTIVHLFPEVKSGKWNPFRGDNVPIQSNFSNEQGEFTFTGLQDNIYEVGVHCEGLLETGGLELARFSVETPNHDFYLYPKEVEPAFWAKVGRGFFPSRITYRFSPDMPTKFIEPIESALETWASIGCNTRVGFRQLVEFEKVSNWYDNPDFKFQMNDLDDVYARTIYGTRKLGIGQFVQFDSDLQHGKYWTVDSQPIIYGEKATTYDGISRMCYQFQLPGDAVDIETIAMHEIGHALGLAHAREDSFGTMKENQYSCEWDHTLSMGDVNAFQSVYALSLGSPLVVAAKCPVELEVVDPDGRITNKLSAGIPDSQYYEASDEESNGPGDTVVIYNPMGGQYHARISPKPNAETEDTYSLSVIRGGESEVIAIETAIGDIPEEGYSFPAEPIELASYNLVWKTHVESLVYDHEYNVILRNNMTEQVTNVRFDIVDVPESVTLIECDTVFSSIASGDSELGKGTFVIRVDESVPFDLEALFWQIIPYFESDFTRNGSVNIEDLAILSGVWLTDNIDVDIAPLPDGDGIVDVLDLQLFAKQWLEGIE